MAKTIVKIGNVTIGGDDLVIIAGPCAVESEEITFKAAETVVELKDKLGVQVIFKSSYTKANRLSGTSFSTIGRGKALSILEKVKGRFGLSILTDVHTNEEVAEAADVADCLQIPAFLCRQTELVQAAAKTKLPVNIKKGQFLAPEDMKPLADKVLAKGNDQVLLTERGTSFGYRDLVVDFRGLVVMTEFGFPVIFDCTHTVQKPGAAGGSSGGDRKFVLPLAKAAVALGVDGLFIETHPDPSKAVSDKDCQLPTTDLIDVVREVLSVHK